VPQRILFTVLAGQFILAAALAGLYVAHVRHSSVFKPESLSYLRRYYYVSAHETFLWFSKRAFIGTFSYMADTRWAKLVMLIYATGVSALLAHRGGDKAAYGVSGRFASDLSPHCARFFLSLVPGTRHISCRF
jgi:hypothetical protein